MRIFVFALVALVFLCNANCVSAQFGSNESVLRQELEELKEDILVLQRQSYRDKGDETALDASGVVVKVGEMDENLRQAIGKIDELEFKIKQLSEKMDMINKDIDIRFKMIEGKPIEGDFEGKDEKAKTFEAPVANNAPKSLVGEGIAKGDDLPPVNGASAEEIYQKGMDALKANNNELAESSFNSVLKRFPKDKLAANAQYWLGETYYAKKDYTGAAKAFAKGIKDYKDSAKAPDSLLKLGMSMQALNKKDEACAAFKSMEIEFPKVDPDVLKKANDAAKKLGCN